MFNVCIHLFRMLLLGGLLVCISCCSEYLVEKENKSSVVIAARSLSLPTSPTDFFGYSCAGIDSVINTLRNIDKEKNFVTAFLEKYGVPLWNYTCILKGENEVSYYVPIYQGKSLLSIDSFWFFHISEGEIIYAPFSRTDERIKDNEQRFVFDWLTWKVFGENNAYGLSFIEKESSSRAWILVERCWDVYTGTANDLKYQYTNCIRNAFWVDETVYWLAAVPEDDPIGGSASVGGGSCGSSATSASCIFNNDNFTDDSWSMVDYLLEDILEDCMGEALYNGIKEKLNGDKVTLRFSESDGSSYNWSSKTLSMSVSQLESNVLFHEMFHLYQSLSESEQSFENSLMNREIEAHYAQYLFSKNNTFLFDVETDFIYLKNERLRACRSIEDYIDDYGVIQDGIELIDLGDYLEFVVTSVFRSDGYENLPLNNVNLGQTFENINELNKNCKP